MFPNKIIGKIIIELIIYIILLMGAGQGFLLAAFLLKRKINPLPSKVWGFTIFIFALDLIMVCFHNSGLYLKYPHLMGISAIFPFMYGPLVYIYISVTGMKFKHLPIKYYLHFIPALAYLIWGIFEVYSQSAQFKIDLIEEKITLPVLVYMTFIIPIHGYTYMFLSIKKLKKLNFLIKMKYSDIDNSTFYQMRHLVFGNIIVWTMVIISYVVDVFTPTEFKTNVIIYIPLAILIFNLGWKSLSSPEIDIRNENEDAKSETNDDKSKPYQKSGLATEIATKYVASLEELMLKEKPYLKSELNLSDLAEQLKITPHNLSQILNTHKNQSFYDYVNFYRIQEVKKLIKSDKEKKMTLISLAFEAGFSSKSSFNTTFKKFEGTTPSAYRNSLSS